MRQFLLYLYFCLCGFSIIAQPRVDSLQSVLNSAYGKEKLILLHQLTQEYFDGNDTKKALKSARQATALADRIITDKNDLITENDYILKATSYFMIGKAYYKRRQYNYAQNYLQQAIKASLELQRTDHILDAEGYLAKIETRDPAEEKKFISKLKALETGITSSLISGSSDINLTTTLKLARNYEAKDDIPKAIEKYEKAINLLRDRGDSEKVIELTAHVAELHQKAGNYNNAIATYEEISVIKSSSGDSTGVEESQRQIAKVIDDMEELIIDKKSPGLQIRSKVPSTLPLSSAVTETESLKQLATKFEESEDFEQSLSYYKLYIETSEKLKEEEYNRELALLEQGNEIEVREKEISLLQQDRKLQELTLAKNNEEIEEQTRLRNTLIIGTILIASLALALYLLYRDKRKAHKSLTHAYDDLNQTQKQLSQAERRISTLLNQQVSHAVAQELLSEDSGTSISQKFVCVMFLDIRGFTPFAESRTPEDIIQYQNDVFGFMIEIIEKNHGIINQFLGDGFMATFGAPVSSGNDCENAYQASVAIVNKLEELNASNKIPHTKVGIGLHAGPVVAGNVGTEERKQYSITGNTVILASRIEQLNKQFNTQLIISEDVYKHLNERDGLETNYEDVVVKGRSEPIRVLKVA